jgi:hypothetical protein
MISYKSLLYAKIASIPESLGAFLQEVLLVGMYDKNTVEPETL